MHPFVFLIVLQYQYATELFLLNNVVEKSLFKNLTLPFASSSLKCALRFPYGYRQRNYLDFYVNRNIEVPRFLQKKPGYQKKMLVVAGHSEGSTIAAKMALVFPRITHLIYSGGNPMGRISTVIERARSQETDSTREAHDIFAWWTQIVADPDNLKDTGDTYKATFDFSIPPIQYLLRLKIPVLIKSGQDTIISPLAKTARLIIIHLTGTKLLAIGGNG